MTVDPQADSYAEKWKASFLAIRFDFSYPASTTGAGKQLIWALPKAKADFMGK